MNTEAKVCILDYGSGNVKSVHNLFVTIAQDVVVSNSEREITASTHLVLPGVGSFGAAMEKIKKNIPLHLVEKEVRVRKKPFLGICVGMQVLAERGFEFGDHAGLGWIPGTVDRLDSKGAPLPHIGWNSVEPVKSSPLLHETKREADFYFVHSFVFHPADRAHVLATTHYGEDFCSLVGHENILGVQFHPEKSQKTGRLLMENFLKMKP